MPRARALAPFLCLSLLAPVVHADEPETSPLPSASSPDAPPPSPEAIAEAWKALVDVGDKARARGRVQEALTAYRQARALREDPELMGRMGLYLLELDNPIGAGSFLLNAIERGAGKSPQEKEKLVRGFVAVRARICMVAVHGNVYDAKVDINGRSVSENLGANFRRFEGAGRLVVVGHSEELGEARADVDCPAGGEADVYLRWKLPERAPLPAPTVPAVEVVPSTPPAPLAVTKRLPPKVAPIVEYSKQEDPYAYEETKDSIDEARGKTPPTRGVVVGGPVVVFGAATWAPAVGFSVAGGVRPNRYVSFELEARAAWLAGDVKGEAITTMTAGGLFAICGHWQWLFGCGLAHLGVIAVNWDDAPFEEDSADVFVRPGFGGRVGARVHLGPSWGVQVSGDVLGLTRGTRIVVEQNVLLEQPPVMVGTSLAGFWRF